MSDIKVEGFKVRSACSIARPSDGSFDVAPQASEILAALAEVFNGYTEPEKKTQIKKVCFRVP